jgi:hypothetical protein
MMKYLQIVLILVLIIFCSYLYMDRKNTVKSFNEKLAVLEANSKEFQGDCETRIAYLKAEMDRQTAKKKMQPGIPSLRDLIEKLPTNPEKVQIDTLVELSAILKLDEKQEMQVRAEYSDFEKAKDQVFEKCAREKISFLDPVRRKMINDARRDTMGKIGDILTEEQLKAFKENAFDLKLGLRVIENTVDKAR